MLIISTLRNDRERIYEWSVYIRIRTRVRYIAYYIRDDMDRLQSPLSR